MRHTSAFPGDRDHSRPPTNTDEHFDKLNVLLHGQTFMDNRHHWKRTLVSRSSGATPDITVETPHSKPRGGSFSRPAPHHQALRQRRNTVTGITNPVLNALREPEPIADPDPDPNQTPVALGHTLQRRIGATAGPEPHKRESQATQVSLCPRLPVPLAALFPVLCLSSVIRGQI